MCHVPDASALSLRRLWQSAQLLSLMRVVVAVALGCARRLNSRLCGCTVAQQVVHFPCACGALTRKFHFRRLLSGGSSTLMLSVRCILGCTLSHVKNLQPDVLCG